MKIRSVGVELFYVFQPEVLQHINTTRQSIRQQFIYTKKNSIFCQGDMFRPYKVILRPSKKTDPRVVYASLHCKHLGSHNTMKHKQLLDLSSWRA